MDRIKELEELIINFDKKWGGIMSGVLILDSNIWMSKSYEALFLEFTHYLHAREKILKILPDQFDEIVNIKDKDSGSDKAILARIALSRIEAMVDKRVIDMGAIKSSPNRKAYADPVILHYIMNEVTRNSSVMLVTDDRELRIRAKYFIQSNNFVNIEIIEGATLAQEFSNYAELCDELEYLNKDNMLVRLRHHKASELSSQEAKRFAFEERIKAFERREFLKKKYENHISNWEGRFR